MLPQIILSLNKVLFKIAEQVNFKRRLMTTVNIQIKIPKSNNNKASLKLEINHSRDRIFSAKNKIHWKAMDKIQVGAKHYKIK